MKLIVILATLTSALAIAIPAKLQERQCLLNGFACDISKTSCCSGNCNGKLPLPLHYIVILIFLKEVICGRLMFTCEPAGKKCLPPSA
ncbi:hypothetical protein GMOD_00008350 [Pyrenophora seminiperda CCB06]|uniref:Uncharacterized protein n=1 Tax=Pyrenophora seminiperda CCB06 TaxID=1302712 RepID=A0A3M7M2L2_9PLEO|nr:hypothetical protein GMOD_00008350 [Pyrenophora seminiperda CCB06]